MLLTPEERFKTGSPANKGTGQLDELLRCIIESQQPSKNISDDHDLLKEDLELLQG